MIILSLEKKVKKNIKYQSPKFNQQLWHLGSSVSWFQVFSLLGGVLLQNNFEYLLFLSLSGGHFDFFFCFGATGARSCSLVFSSYNNIPKISSSLGSIQSLSANCLYLSVNNWLITVPGIDTVTSNQISIPPAVAISAAKALIAPNPQYDLSHINLDPSHWGKSLFRRTGFKKRM